MKCTAWSLTLLLICASTLGRISEAQDASQGLKPTMYLRGGTAIERTPEQMADFDARNAVNSFPGDAPFRPTVSAAQYSAMKNVAGRGSPTTPGAGLVSTPAASVLTKFPGASQCDGTGGCWTPPDVAGAIGTTQFVSVSNNVFEVRGRNGALNKTNSLNGLFGYSATSMFDPRVQYDEGWQRWIITADSFPDSNGNQLLGIAVSKTSNAVGNWWIYFINPQQFTGAGSFYDYPMLGMTQDAVVFTANVFPASGGATSSLFAIAKERIYNGFGFSVPIWLGLVPTLQPAHQLVTDQNAYAWLAAAGGVGITMYALADPSNPNRQTLTRYAVANVASYSGPPSASQPASCAPSGATLDTLDGRFQNAGTQAGDTYYQVHTIGSGISPRPRYYIITGLNSFAPKVSFYNDVYASQSSYDFNPSIVADTNGKLGITWSYTDTTVNASIRFADNNGGNPGPGSGITVFTSASCYTNNGVNGWGKYSQVSYDPGTGPIANMNTATFWIDNETIPNLNVWSTEIAKMKY